MAVNLNDLDSKPFKSKHSDSVESDETRKSKLSKKTKSVKEKIRRFQGELGKNQVMKNEISDIRFSPKFDFLISDFGSISPFI